MSRGNSLMEGGTLAATRVGQLFVNQCGELIACFAITESGVRAK